MEPAGAGYINFFLDRAAVVRGSRLRGFPGDEGKIIVEHTNINPNKAAHIGHLRNATIGDTFVRILKAVGRNVEVQNYIDNTGVQVADVIVGLKQVERKTREDIRRMNAGCWVMRLDAEGKEDDKIIVRSNGTVTYVGKDIAYQLWKVGLLDKDFNYVEFDGSANVWATTSGNGQSNHPPFGEGRSVYNV